MVEARPRSNTVPAWTCVSTDGHVVVALMKGPDNEGTFGR